RLGRHSHPATAVVVMTSGAEASELLRLADEVLVAHVTRCSLADAAIRMRYASARHTLFWGLGDDWKEPGTMTDMVDETRVNASVVVARLPVVDKVRSIVGFELVHRETSEHPQDRPADEQNDAD